MTRVLIMTHPSLSVHSGEAVGSCHLYVRVKLDHYCGEVLCRPSELEVDDLPEWLPTWLKLWIKRFGRRVRTWRAA